MKSKKRWYSIVGVVLLAMAHGQPSLFATPAPTEIVEHNGLSEQVTQGERVMAATTQLTGTAINPLFGVTALGMWHYFSTSEELRDQLPLYDQPVIWGVLILLMLLMCFNSTIGETMPFLKIPLNALGDLVNKGGAVVVLPVVLHEFAQAFAPPTAVVLAAVFEWLGPSTAYAAEGSTVVIGIGSVSGVYLLLGGLVSLVVGAFAYAAVWVVWNVIDVTILLLPIPSLDAILKSTRLAAVGAVFGTAALSPWLGMLVALTMLLVCWFLSGWAFRLSVMGFVFATDFLFWRKSSDTDAAAGIPAFITATAGKRWKLPARLYGCIQRRPDDTLFFVWRPWLVGSLHEIELGPSLGFQGGSTLLYPVILDSTGNISLFRLPPRYRNDLQIITLTLGLSSWRDVSIVRGMWSYLQQVFWGSPTAFQRTRH